MPAREETSRNRWAGSIGNPACAPSFDFALELGGKKNARVIPNEVPQSRHGERDLLFAVRSITSKRGLRVCARTEAFFLAFRATRHQSRATAFFPNQAIPHRIRSNPAPPTSLQPPPHQRTTPKGAVSPSLTATSHPLSAPATSHEKTPQNPYAPPHRKSENIPRAISSPAAKYLHRKTATLSAAPANAHEPPDAARQKVCIPAQ